MQRTILTPDAKWWTWEGVTVANKRELRELSDHRLELPDVPEQPPIMDQPKTGWPSCKTSADVAQLIRFRTGVPNMTEEEVWEARLPQMQSLVQQHIQIYTQRKDFESGKLTLKMRDSDGKEKTL